MKTEKSTLAELLNDVDIKDIQTPCIQVKRFNARFDGNQVLNDINLEFNRSQINCIIGPSGSGKSTLLRCINRINDDIASFKHKGEILLKSGSIYSEKDATHIRRRLGMVFQKPFVFPVSIIENVLFGLQFNKSVSQQKRLRITQEQLKAVALWDEVRDRLDSPAADLSLGQQQRLCIARTLAVNPEVILLDEPTSSVDPVSSRAIEDLMLQLKDRYTIIFVTHNILQARRIADRLIVMCEGKLIEQGDKNQLFKNPTKQQTWEYLNNEYCQC